MADCKHGTGLRSFFVGIELEGGDDTFALLMQCECGTVMRTPGLAVERWRIEGPDVSRPRFGIALKNAGSNKRVFRVDLKGCEP